MAAVNHTERAHALLSASSAERWINCTPSPRMEEKFPNTTSKFAEEGTMAHEYAELLLNKELQSERPVIIEEGIAKVKASEWYDEDFEEAVQEYVQYVLNLMMLAKSADPHAVCVTEKRVKFDLVVPEGFGTADCIIIAGRKAMVIDLKFGRGVRVDAYDNSQLKLYGIGALQEFYGTHEIDSFTLTIFQPRLQHVSSFDIGTAELVEWAQNEVMPAAEKAVKGEGKTNIGDWCRFCKAKGTCPAMVEELNEFVALTKVDVDEERAIERVLEVGDIVSEFISHMRGLALRNALNGNPPKGYKAIAGTSRRKFIDEGLVGEHLISEGYQEKDIYQRKLIAITRVERLVGKATFKDEFDKFVTQTESPPALVKETDPRPAISNKNDFDVL